MDFHDIDALTEKRADVYARLKKIDEAAGSNRSLTSAEQRDFDRYTKEIDDLSDRIDKGNSAIRHAIVNGNNDLRSSTVTSSNGSVRLLSPKQRVADREQNLPSGIQPSDISAGRYLRGLITNNWKGAEAEEELQYTKRSDGGAAGGIGGFLLPQLVSDRIIDLARSRMVVVQAGAQTLEMQSERVRIAKITGDATPQWRPENTTINPSTVTFGAIDLRARTVATYITVSRELAQDASNADSVLEGVLTKAMALEWDRAALMGNGAGETPLGLRYQPSVPLTTGTPSATTTYLPVLRQLRDIYNSNYPGDASGLSIVWAPRTSFTYTSIVDGQTQPLRIPPSLENVPRYVTTQVVNDTTTYGSTDALPQFMGDFSQLILGMRWPLEVQVSLEAGSVFQSNQIAIRTIQRGDIAVAQPTFFSIVTGSTA